MRVIKSSRSLHENVRLGVLSDTTVSGEIAWKKPVMVGKEKEQDLTEIGCLHSELIRLTRSEIPPPFPEPLTLTREEEMGSCTYISLSSQISHRKLIACCTERN